MDHADRPSTWPTRRAWLAGTSRVLAPTLLAAAIAAAGGGTAVAKPAVKPRSGSYSGDIGVFTLSFKVSPNGERLTGLRTDYEGTVNCGPPDDNAVFFDFPTLEIGSGRFDGEKVVDSNSDISPRYTIKGNFNTPTHAEGTINVFFTYPHNALPPCNETEPFSATHR